MDRLKGEYWCDSCKMQFKYYKQYLSHKYLNHEEQELQPEIDSDCEESQNYSNNFKSFCEMHIGKTPSKEQLKNNERTVSSEDVYNPLFDSRDHKSIQFYHGELTESTAKPSSLESAIDHVPEPRSRCHSNPESTANKRSLSLKYNQMEACRRKGNSVTNKSQSSMVSKCDQLETRRLEENTGINRSESSMLPQCTQGISEQLKRNQSSTTEYGQMHGNYQQTNVNLPSTSFVMRPMIDIIPQFNRDHCAPFFQYNPWQFNGCKMNQHFNTNQIPMPLGYRKKDFDTYELYRQCKTNRLSMSPESREMDLSTHLMNQQANANPQDVKDAHVDIPFPERNSSPQHRIFNKMDLNLKENSIKSRRKLYSVDRSNTIYGEPNTTENVEKRSAIVSTITQNEIVEHDKRFASNLSIKNSNVRSLETPKRRESPNRYSYADIGEESKHCYGFEKEFIQKSDIAKNPVTDSAAKTYSCDLCRNTFSNEYILARHHLVRTVEKPYDCYVCGKKFSKKDTLKAHNRIHTGEKPYDCDVCGKKFTQKKILKVHYRIHTGEKPYDCDVCGKKFSKKFNLKEHSRIHTGERPYDCDECGKKFNRKSILKEHVRIHTGEKPYDCDECGKKFNRKSSLNVHYRIHI
ncbi:zinc finger protein 782 [Trichonephila clavipes]|nr:zinc finger protein 782 [Trichonephila clavipes]